MTDPDEGTFPAEAPGDDAVEADEAAQELDGDAEDASEGDAADVE